jgi:hypothetical protein
LVDGFCFARMGELLAIYFIKTTAKDEWLIAKRAHPSHLRPFYAKKLC